MRPLNNFSLDFVMNFSAISGQVLLDFQFNVWDYQDK